MLFLIVLSPAVTWSATERDFDKVTTYATLMGRAVACGENINYSSKKVGAWMDRTFSKKEIGNQIIIFTTAIQYAAEQQKNGNSPDTCGSAVKAFKKVNWP